MALTKDKKAEVLANVKNRLESSKMTVFATYSGTSVKAMQELRSEARQTGTTVSVVKNRLFKKALSEIERFADIDASTLTGQLMYAFNDQDEVAPAQTLAAFAKTQPQVQFVGGLNAEGQILSADEIQVLASLPAKEVLRAQLVGTIGAPLSGFVNVLSGNIRGVLNVLSARSEQLN